MAFRCPRWTLANALPVLFTVWIIVTLWFLYFALHLLHYVTPGPHLTPTDVSRSFLELVISQTLTVMLMVCFLQAIFTDPGSVPDTAAWWLPRGSEESAEQAPPPSPGATGEAVLHHEVKGTTGHRRVCKWCDRYKPDRCHHCRVCQSCVLRMDHHCPWIANCVGFRNHKYFFLLVWYSVLNCVFIESTMWRSLHRAVGQETDPWIRFGVVFGITLAMIMTILLTLFFALHIWLMFKATTTIEFCEKRTRRMHPGMRVASYDISYWENIKAVLGSNVLLWFLPLAPPDGDGLSFAVAGHQRIEGMLRPPSHAQHLADGPLGMESPFLTSPLARDPRFTGGKAQAGAARSEGRERGLRYHLGQLERARERATEPDVMPPEVTGKEIGGKDIEP